MSNMKELAMSTQKELAWQALTLSKDRFSDAAVVIADKLAFEGEQPTEAEIDEYRAATKALARANSEYAKTIKLEADRITDEQDQENNDNIGRYLHEFTIKLALQQLA